MRCKLIDDLRRNKMSQFFDEIIMGLLQAVAIERGELKVWEVSGMPAKTLRSL